MEDKDKGSGYVDKDKENKGDKGYGQSYGSGYGSDQGINKDQDKDKKSTDKDKDKEKEVVLPPASYLTAGHVSCDQLRDALSSAGLVFSPHEVR